MSRSTNDLVREFHLAFGVPVNDVPTVPSAEIRRLRLALIAEELQELATASGFRFNYSIADEPTSGVDLIEAADACGDLDYVVQGTNLAYGFPAARVVEEIHRSNMSKLDANGKPIYRADGKVLKGPGYFKPDIAKVLRKSPEHVCGLQGYNGMIDPPCPACEENRIKWSKT